MTNVAKLKLLSQKKNESFKQKLLAGDKPKGTYYKESEDARLWKLTMDKEFNGKAVLRFLPNKNEEGFDVVTRISYNDQHKHTKKYYIENSLTSLNEADPAYEYNGTVMQMYPKGTPEREANMIKRKIYHYANVLVIKDEANPENEGKVFIFKFGNGLFDKIKNAQMPQYDDETPFSPFDMFSSKNFRLVSKNKGGYPNFDDSTFSGDLNPLSKDEAKIEELYEKCYDLDKEILGPDNFKSYAELQKVLNNYLGKNLTQSHQTLEESIESDDLPQVKSKAVKSVIQDDSFDDEEDFLQSLTALVSDDD